MIGVVADDLTGAAELGAVGWRYGLRSQVLLSGEPNNQVDLVCIDTDSRSCTPEEAARRAGAAAAKLRNAGAQWIYKKVDSVLRGNVVAEIEAIMKELGFNRALLAPANPSLGRTICNETYLVHGQPIHKTDFAKDPEHPRASARVLDLLQHSGSFPIRVSLPELATSSPGIVVAEVASVADLKLWAEQKMKGSLPAGGAEFFGALLVAAGNATRDERNASNPNERELFICGSISESSRGFIQAASERGTPVFSLPNELIDGSQLAPGGAEKIAHSVIAALRSHSRVILSVGLPLVSDRAIAARLTAYLVQVAEVILGSARVDHVYMEGGATAAALLQRLGLNRVNVIEELAPGVVTMASGGERSINLTIKPGSYMWPTELRERCISKT